jgi:hypothetical protein
MLKAISSLGFSTKNVPDAIEWHSASYWDHIFGEDVRRNLLPSQQLLDDHIGLPILPEVTTGWTRPFQTTTTSNR